MNTPLKASYDKKIMIAGKDYSKEQKMQKRWEEGHLSGEVPGDNLTLVLEYDMRGIEAITLIIKVHAVEGSGTDVNLLVNGYAYYDEDDTSYTPTAYPICSETLSDGDVKKIVVNEPLAKLEVYMSTTGDMLYSLDYIARW